MADLMDVYDDARLGLVDVVRGLDERSLALNVPATPDWTIHDVIAHLASDVAGILANDFPSDWFFNIGNPDAIDRLNAWTERMVAERRTVPLKHLASDWERDATALRAILGSGGHAPEGIPPFFDRVLITDLAVHTHDVYGAIGLELDRESDAVRIAVAFYLSGLPLWQSELPALQIVTPQKTYTCGSGGGQTTLRIDRFELFRALSGRRSPDQIRAYEWDGDPEPFVGMFAPYGTRAGALIE